MIRHSVVALLLISVLLPNARAQTEKTEAVDAKGYGWRIQGSYMDEALRRSGDVRNGLLAYEVCAACHLPSGAGRADGTFPQFAGQHATVLIKQIADIRDGRRDNPKMYPFVATLTDPQEVADVAAYISSLCIPANNGRYEGRDAVQQATRGKALYGQACVSCHGRSGEGDKENFYPVLAGQHYRYLLRQMRDIREGRRHNAKPEMTKLIGQFSDGDLVAISAYIANLAIRDSMCKRDAKK